MTKVRYEVYFDDMLKCRSGKVIPFWDIYQGEDDKLPDDKSTVWFHERYGCMFEYRLHRVDNTNVFIAEKTGKKCRNTDLNNK